MSELKSEDSPHKLILSRMMNVRRGIALWRHTHASVVSKPLKCGEVVIREGQDFLLYLP